MQLHLGQKQPAQARLMLEKMNESDFFHLKSRNKVDDHTVPADGESHFLEKHSQAEPALTDDGTLNKTNVLLKIKLGYIQ